MNQFFLRRHYPTIEVGVDYRLYWLMEWLKREKCKAVLSADAFLSRFQKLSTLNFICRRGKYETFKVPCLP